MTTEPRDADDRTLALAVLVVAAALLLTPARALWAAPDAPWWSPFLVWAGLVSLSAWLARRARGSHADVDR